MSEAVSALGGARFEGLAVVEDCGLSGMITLRGDLSAAAVKKAALAGSGCAVPGERKAVVSDKGALLWMSPDELLVLCPYDEVGARVAAMTKALGKAHALAVNVSDARAVLRLSGPKAREVLAKLSPVDLSPEAFGVGDLRRSRIAQVAAAYWLEDEESFRIICFRSVAEYVFGVLKVAAAKGSAVGYF
ncbi:sarcosine oxidase subunit gamma [Seohaeicola zhoushanensis]|uniref:Sarcosine oxidase subunit gamma n=1 Tax=Seohaeicola zhoushanensis TaxID=1569283 RepID=A0A8J3M5Z1_9RHOB|nr:sarcosine oxidase subunit gamma family protein [Seohaeicola zhoushanensis]GHF45064.1 sarcosine oxidase subunit gamma [Seohaeicola zhoushanensis]